MGDMANSTDVDGGLAGDNLRSEGSHQLNIVVDVLHSQVGLGFKKLMLGFN